MPLKDIKHVVQVVPVHAKGGPRSELPPQLVATSRTRPFMQQTARLWRILVNAYHRTHVSQRGMYSIERLQAFHSYCEETSAVRAAAVCILTPLPPLLAILLLECLPLKDPSEGWQANYMFWIRFFVSAVIILVGSTYQIIDMVARIQISPFHCLLMSIIAGSVYIVTVIAVASLWVFPVPFGVVVGVIPCFLVFTVAFMLTIGLQSFKSNLGLGKEIKLQFYVLGSQAALAIIYPAFNGLYFEATPNQRAGLVLVLPLTKLLMKNAVAWSCSHLEDYIPAIAVFSVEVFNALYIATCMQAAQSTVATLIIVGLDAGNGVLSFRVLIEQTKVIPQQRSRLDKKSAQASPVNLVQAVLDIWPHLDSFETSRGSIRVRAPLKLGSEVEDILKSIASHKALSQRVRVQNVPSMGQNTPIGAAEIRSPEKGPSEKHASVASPASTNETDQLKLTESTLRLLFHTEYLTLVKYVEFAIPMLFAVYLSILCQLPTHQYYPYTRDMVPGQLEAMLASLGLYVGLEILSFVAMHVALKRRFNLSVLYQLSFVLETQMVQVQSRLFVWIVFILQFTLQHFGVDFSFRFPWMHKTFH